MKALKFRSPNRRPLWAIAAISAALAVLAGVLDMHDRRGAAGPEILVYAEDGMINTARWIEYLRARGFRVSVRYDPHVVEMQRYLQVPPRFRGNHLALVEGYIVEGDVPAEDILRLLAEHPRARGLSVPGFPGRAPGMEGLIAGNPKPYDVLMFRDDETAVVYATH